MNASWQQLAHQYETVAHLATGLVVKVVGPDTVNFPIRFGAQENVFCARVARAAGGCPGCREVQKQLRAQLQRKTAPHCTQCFAGLTVFVIPVLNKGQHVATLFGGHVLQSRPNRRQVAVVKKQLAQWGVEIDVEDLQRAYAATPVICPERMRATIRLLDYLAQSLGESAIHQALAHSSSESAPVAIAKDYAAAHLSEPVRMHDAATYVHLDRYHFCRLFKKETGTTFGEYQGRLRVEKVKQLLADRSFRIGEAALASGFGSIPQFNRVFRKYAGMTPSQCRLSLTRRGAV